MSKRQKKMVGFSVAVCFALVALIAYVFTNNSSIAKKTEGFATDKIKTNVVVANKANSKKVVMPNDDPLEACEPDCFDDKFGQLNTATVLVDSCPINITYRCRLACPPINHQDVYIGTIGVDPNCSPACSTYFFNMPMATLIQKATLAFLGSNVLDGEPCYFQPTLSEDIGTCRNEWRVLKAGCFSKRYDMPGDQYAYNLVPCHTNSKCCLDLYRVCIVQDPNNPSGKIKQVIQLANNPPPTLNCGGTIAPQGATTCQPICVSVTPKTEGKDNKISNK